jgi:leucyl aminopeptidase
MLEFFLKNQPKNAIPITIVSQNQYPAWLAKQTKFTQTWLSSSGFRNEPGSIRLIPDSSGKLIRILTSTSEMKNFWATGSLPLTLPEGDYYFDFEVNDYQYFVLAWGLGAYQFSRYKKPLRQPARLVLPPEISAGKIINIIESIYWVRDLINTPTDDMGPTELAKEAANFCKKNQLKFNEIIGTNLLKNNYASIYTVGRASDDAPRLVDFRFGNKKHRKLTLVGKGVCFDTGGLDLKSSNAMLIMKKDMGGAAHVLGLARMIIEAKLPVYLRVLIPIVENSVSGNAYRPGDVITSRKGLTIEIGNTDAEGRVILADALTEAASENPDLIIDISTLTGAARVALGTELPAMFANQDELADDVIKGFREVMDPVWRLPLFSLYRDSLNSSIADINNNSTDGYGGAITAGLFLKEFVPDHIPWLHFDLMAWNLKPRPGKPVGGEAMALRGLFHYIEYQFCKK